MNRDAVISECGLYRYSLTRDDGAARQINWRKTLVFALNNPSIADHKIDDPTARRGWGYVLSWGYWRMIFVNTNPHRSTDPASAILPPEEILRENDGHLLWAAKQADLIICAWGTKARPELAVRAVKILSSVRPLHVLALSKDGIPKHPLYLKGDLQPQLWKPQAALALAGGEGE